MAKKTNEVVIDPSIPTTTGSELGISVVAEPKIEVKQVTLGVTTINDHEARITMLEAKIAGLTK